MAKGSVYLEPRENAKVELTIRRSRFIGHLRVAGSVEEAKKIIREISKEHSNATHNCWAYKVGVDFPQKHYSDGGEPSGTAGKPILGEIERANLTNAVIVVTRYFGGIKLGVRGLIEAYGQTAREAIKAAGVVRKVKGKEIMIEVPYYKQSLIYSQFKSMGIDDSNWEALYGEKVRLYGKIPDFLVEEVEELLSNYVGQGWVFSWSWVDGAY